MRPPRSVVFLFWYQCILHLRSAPGAVELARESIRIRRQRLTSIQSQTGCKPTQLRWTKALRQSSNNEIAMQEAHAANTLQRRSSQRRGAPHTTGAASAPRTIASEARGQMRHKMFGAANIRVGQQPSGRRALSLLVFAPTAWPACIASCVMRRDAASRGGGPPTRASGARRGTCAR